MEISIDPIIFYLGNYGVRWYTLVELLSIVVALALFVFESKRTGFPIKHTFLIFALAVISLFLFAKLLHVLENWELYEANPAKIADPAGTRINGIIIGGFIFVWLYCRLARLSPWHVQDIAMPCALFFMAGLRIGCLINGCCYGMPCEQGFHLIYSNPHTLAPIGMPLYPTQLLHAVWSFAVFFVIWFTRKRLKLTSSTYLISLMLYETGDFFIRFWRAGESYAFGLTSVQWVDLVIIIAASTIYTCRWRKYAKR